MAEEMASCASSGQDETSEERKDPQSRVNLLSDALDKTVEKSISSAKFALFAKSYPDIYRKHKDEFKDIYNRFKEFLKENMKLEIQTLFEEENLPGLLNELDDLIKRTPRDPKTPAWRPSGVPEDDTRAHLVALRQCQRNRLQSLLKKEQKTTRHLESLINHHTSKIQQLQKSTEELLSFYEQGCQEGEEIANIVMPYSTLY